MEFLKVLNGECLSIDEAQSLFAQILSGELSSFKLAALLGVLAARRPQASEILGARAAVRASCLVRSIHLPDAVDVCGTGGDGKDTFNISTCVAFVLSGAGIKVVKNGNYSASSKCGSSNVLEALGVTFPTNEMELSEGIRREAPVFIHAPTMYPALRVVAQVRKELQFRTIFNLLGPLLNPVQIGAQMVGVPDRTTLRLYGEVLEKIQKRFITVTSEGGYDEVSLTGPTYIVSHHGQFELHPEDFGFSQVSSNDLLGEGSATENATTILDILQAKASDAKMQVVAANAGVVLWMLDNFTDLKESTSRALESIKSGAAFNALLRAKKG